MGGRGFTNGRLLRQVKGGRLVVWGGWIDVQGRVVGTQDLAYQPGRLLDASLARILPG